MIHWARTPREPYQPTLFHDITTEAVRDILTQQALGPLLTSRAVVPFMRVVPRLAAVAAHHRTGHQR
jgi:hypothetical protein